MYRFILLILAVVSSVNIAYSQQMESLDDLFNAQRDAIDHDIDAFNASVDEAMAQFEEKYKGMLEEHKEFASKVTTKWGDDDVVESDNKTWVEYNDNLNSRSVVDFEGGDVKVEVLLTPEELASGAAEAKLAEAVANVISSRGRTLDYNSKYESTQSLSDNAILNQQLDLSSYGVNLDDVFATSSSSTQGAAVAPPMPTVGDEHTLTERDRSSNRTVSTPVTPPTPTVGGTTMAQRRQNEAVTTPSSVDVADSGSSTSITELAQVIVEKTEREVVEVVDKDGNKRVVVSLDLKLVEDHISQRAAKYSKIIATEARRFSIAESVIYAVMEQESSFNPAAKSGAPAYGLMQLVPTSGARDAYNYVYKKDKIVSGNYLYDPQNNVELGAAYLTILETRSFSKITNESCRLLCMIAAYNCGAGNVSRAIIGSTNLPKAIPEINKMSYDQLYSHFRQHLPNETKEYIQKVTKNITKYSASKL